MRTARSEIKRAQRRLSEINAELVAAYNPKAAALFLNISADLAMLEAFEALADKEKLGRLEMFRAGFRAARDELMKGKNL